MSIIFLLIAILMIYRRSNWATGELHWRSRWNFFNGNDKFSKKYAGWI